MPLKKTPREGGGPRRRTHWTNVKVGNGDKFLAYATGVTNWYECHTKHGGTQPCMNWMTDGAVPCLRCHQPIETMGYVALWNEIDHSPIMVLVHDHQREMIDKLPRGVLVRVMRDTHKSAPISLQEVAPRRFIKDLAPRWSAADAIDLEHDLLRMWGSDPLRVWAARHAGVDARKEKDGTASGGKVVSAADADDVVSALKALGDDPAPQDVAAALSRIKNRAGASEAFVAAVKQAEKNGKHKPE